MLDQASASASPVGRALRRAAAAVALAACFAALAPAASAQDSTISGNTAYLAQECVACHDAVAVGRRIPPLWGLDPGRIIAAMEEFRAGTRDNPTMVTIARGLSPELIAELARYFSQMPAGN